MTQLFNRFPGILFFCLSFLLAAATSASAVQPLRFAVSDILGLEQVRNEWGAFADKLTAISGIELQFVPMRGRDDAFLALSQKRVDLVLAGPAEYVAIRNKTQAVPVAGFSRPEYYSVIVGLKKGPAQTLADLAGKTVALGSVGSTSAHLAPMQVLADNGLDPLRDVRVIHVDKLEASLASLSLGKITAAAMNWNDFQRLSKTLPSPDQYRILGKSPILPGDVLMAGPHVSGQNLLRLHKAFRDHEAELVQAIISVEANAKYKGMHFLVAPDDTQYDYVRRMYSTAGFPGFDSRPKPAK